MVAAGADGRELLVRDESGQLAVTLEPGEGPSLRAGDIVALELAATRDCDADAGARAERWMLLTPFADDDSPFPSPQHEHGRLFGATQRARALRQRARALAAVRAFFDGRGYVEVDSPRRVRCPGLEPEIEAVASGERWLITSPEYHLKRLLAGGLERIYSLGHCFRGGERGAQHLDEFTMLEWYCGYGTLDALMRETEALLRHVAAALHGRAGVAAARVLRFDGREVDLAAPFARHDVGELLERHAGVSLAGAERDARELARRARAAGHVWADAELRYAETFSRLWVDHVEPALGAAPCFVTRFPIALAALSRPCADDPARAERFELYAGGLELANAFGELTNADEQLRRFEHERAERRAAGRAVHAIDERFIAALREGIPPSAGIALGFDRLLMLLLDARDIAEVVPFAPEDV
ncbi:MAG: EF-P lysine aminoacylase GenX [Myxococcales bacterium]|nr:EF-P lysine aminoacylase GenX [Myxococcales bacterium]